jgi:hypothetical protein
LARLSRAKVMCGCCSASAAVALDPAVRGGSRLACHAFKIL